jgi:hypothetical protein
MWKRFWSWLGWGKQPRPEYDVNREPGADKARRNMYPQLTDAEYEEMARKNGWR